MSTAILLDPNSTRRIDFKYALRLVPGGREEVATKAEEIAGKLGLDFKPALLPAPKDVRLTVKQAHKVHAAGDLDRFDVLLRSLAPTLPELKLSADGQPPRWNVVAPAFPGAMLSAAKFKVPAEGPVNLFQAAVSRGEAGKSRIIPLASGPPVATELAVLYDAQVSGLKTFDGNLTVLERQTQLEPLTPGGEYIICFLSRDAALGEVQTAIHLLPHGSHLETDRTADAAGLFGIKPATDAARERATAQRVLARRWWTSPAEDLERMMTSAPHVWEPLPMAKAGQPVAWTKGRLDRDASPTVVFRIDPPKSASDLFVLVTAAKGERFYGDDESTPESPFTVRCAVSGRSTEARIREIAPLQPAERDYPSVAVPPGGALFGTSLGSLQPGETCTLSLSISREQGPFDFQIAIGLQPQGRVPVPHTFDTLVRAVVSRPDPPALSAGGQRQTLPIAALSGFTGEGEWFAALSDGAVQRYRGSFETAGEPLKGAEAVQALVVAPQGDLVALKRDGNAMVLQDLTHSTELGSWHVDEGDEILQTVVSPMGRQVAAVVRRPGSKEQTRSTVLLWTAGSDEPRPFPLPLREPPTASTAKDTRRRPPPTRKAPTKERTASSAAVPGITDAGSAVPPPGTSVPKPRPSPGSASVSFASSRRSKPFEKRTSPKEGEPSSGFLEVF